MNHYQTSIALDESKQITLSNLPFAIANPINEIFLSVVSIWECEIKYQIGKLNFPTSPAIYLPEQRRKHFIKTLVVDEATITQLINLPLLPKRSI